MDVADRGSQRICSVIRHRSFKFEQHLDHGLDLILARMSIRTDRLLDLRGRVLEHGDMGKGCRQEHDAPGLSEQKSRPDIPREEHLLDRHVLRPVLQEEPLQLSVEFRESFHEGRPGVRADGSACDRKKPLSRLCVHDPEPRVRNPGIDPHHPHRLTPVIPAVSVLEG